MARSINCNQCESTALNLTSWIDASVKCGQVDIVRKAAHDMLDIILEEHNGRDRLIDEFYGCDAHHINAVFLEEPDKNHYSKIDASHFTNNMYRMTQPFSYYNAHTYFTNRMARLTPSEHEYFDQVNVNRFRDVSRRADADRTRLHYLVDIIKTTNIYEE